MSVKRLDHFKKDLSFTKRLPVEKEVLLRCPNCNRKIKLRKCTVKVFQYTEYSKKYKVINYYCPYCGWIVDSSKQYYGDIDIV
jgi:uncharacterized protein with PIN domain